MTRNTVPPGSVLATFFAEASESPELSAGMVSVVQATQAEAPGRFDTIFFETSSIFTKARPLPSCPVTTRRTFMVMISPRCVSNLRRTDYTGAELARPRSQGAARSCIIAVRLGRRGRERKPDKFHEHRHSGRDSAGRDARRRHSR